MKNIMVEEIDSCRDIQLSGLPLEGKGIHFEAFECIIPDGADIPTSQVMLIAGETAARIIKSHDNQYLKQRDECSIALTRGRSG